MLFAGIDLHKHTITIVVVDADRKSIGRKRFSNLDTGPIVAGCPGHGFAWPGSGSTRKPIIMPMQS